MSTSSKNGFKLGWTVTCKTGRRAGEQQPCVGTDLASRVDLPVCVDADLASRADLLVCVSASSTQDTAATRHPFARSTTVQQRLWYASRRNHHGGEQVSQYGRAPNPVVHQWLNTASQGSRPDRPSRTVRRSPPVTASAMALCQWSCLYPGVIPMRPGTSQSLPLKHNDVTCCGCACPGPHPSVELLYKVLHAELVAPLDALAGLILRLRRGGQRVGLQGYTVCMKRHASVRMPSHIRRTDMSCDTLLHPVWTAA